MILFHVTTPKKAKLYRNSRMIKKPVRAFDTLMGAMAWAIKTGRSVIYKIESKNVYKMPDHHNQYGMAWWADENITRFSCIRTKGVKP